MKQNLYKKFVDLNKFEKEQYLLIKVKFLII
jgi:hypothetical protein